MKLVFCELNEATNLPMSKAHPINISNKYLMHINKTNQDEIFKKDYHNLVDECELEKTKLDKLINNSIKVFGVIRIVHPLKRYAQKKSVYKILEQRRSSTKCSDELF